MPSPTHYSALDLPKKASAADIKKAWRSIAFDCHPDRAVTRKLGKREEGKLQRRFHRARAAWEVLSDSTRRAEYDGDIRAAARAKRARAAAKKDSTHPVWPAPSPQQQQPEGWWQQEREYMRFARRQDLKMARERQRDAERLWREVQDREVAVAEDAYLRKVAAQIRCKIAYFLLRDYDR